MDALFVFVAFSRSQDKDLQKLETREKGGAQLMLRFVLETCNVETLTVFKTAQKTAVE